MLRLGCYAERISLPASLKLLTPSPANLTDDEAAAIPYGGLMALCFLRKTHIQPGEHVLVYGASGAIGTCAVQLAKHYGATVTGVCTTRNHALVRSLGADAVLDYTKDEIPSGARYDVVFDAAGRKKTSPIKEALRSALSSKGRMISVDDTLVRFKRSDLETLKNLTEAGTLKPVIDRRYSLEQIADAHRYVEQWHKKGNVVITLRG
jgi:NADPH:quinone reductase-like Zn-dependent oxidoreductase